MGACCSAQAADDGDVRPAAGAAFESEGNQDDQWLSKVEDLRRLLVTTAINVEPDGGSAIVSRIEEWTAAQRKSAVGKRPHLAGSFGSVLEDVGASTRTLTVLKGLSQSVVLQAVTFLFVRTGLLKLTNGMLADVVKTWKVKIDLSQRGIVRISHTKTQGKPSQAASLDFRVTVELEERGDKLEFLDVRIELLQVRPNAAVTSTEQVDAIVSWEQRVNNAFAALETSPVPMTLESDEPEDLIEAVRVWRQDMKACWSKLEALRETTVVDIFRLCVPCVSRLSASYLVPAARYHFQLTINVCHRAHVVSFCIPESYTGVALVDG